MKRRKTTMDGGAILLAWIPLALCLSIQTGAAEPVVFNRDIRPVLNRTCLGCHGGVKRAAGLGLRFRPEAVAELKSGHRAIVPGRPDESELIARITHPDPEERMPPEGDPLTAEEIARIRQWISDGAAWAVHWAYVPPQPVPPPEVNDANWVHDPLDAFILARLEREGLAPAPPADPATWLRRVSLDLIGLPPTPAEVQAFLDDSTPGGRARAVDRLLASPHFGERWAAVWMDLARYADTKGYEKDAERTIWRYRDWLIEAFNRDLPYDQFTLEQLAGDLLPDATDEQRIATAFHRNTMTNDEGGTDDEEFRVAAVLDRVNTTSDVWMGTTFSCVQCHHHPYDPFDHQEYYAFLAFFNNTEDADRPSEQPTLQTLSPPDRKRQAALTRERQDVRETLLSSAAAEPIRTAFRTWQDRLRADPEWSRPAIVDTSSSGGANAKILEADEVLFSGDSPETDTLLVSATTSLSSITGLRLETQPDPSLPRGGAGRAADGNFVLSGLDLMIEDETSGVPGAQFVRVSLPGREQFLSLAEVEVFAHGENVARSGSATQSSTDYAAPARLAIDGNTNGAHDQGSVTHTGKDRDAWWEVDLGEPRDVDRITVWHRLDGDTFRRSNGFRIQVLGEQRDVLWQADDLPAGQDPNTLALTGRTVPFRGATADFAQDGFPVDSVLQGSDSPSKGWAVAPRTDAPHRAVFFTNEAVPVPEGAVVRLRLFHRHDGDRYTLGRFRVSLTDDERLAERGRLGPDELRALNTPEADRSEQDRFLLARAFAASNPTLAALDEQLSEIDMARAAMTPVPTPVLKERPPENRRTTRVFERGNWQALGTEVQPATPAALPPFGDHRPRNRLGLAQWLTEPDHPLTSRVAVNRFWEQLFGLGLVETLEDFGTQGEPPSHPELLDWLAFRFAREQAWSMKTFLGTVVLSSTYGQTSRVTPEKLAKDPRNRLLARGPRFRLGAEQVRDLALRVSGLLTPTLYGPSVKPYQPDGIWQSVYSGATWKTAEGKNRYRRGLYTYWKRTSPYPSMLTFDAPSREVCVARRIRTNTPLQALTTLNDPVFVEAAEALAGRLEAEGGTDTEERIRFGLRLVQSREPHPHDVDVLTRLYADTPGDNGLALVAAALLNLDSTLTKE